MSELSEGTPVGVVGGHPAAAEAVSAAGGVARVGGVDEVLADGPAALVTVGEAALLDVVQRGVEVPVLPVDAGRGVRSVPGVAVEPAIEQLVDGDHETLAHPVVGVSSPNRSARALCDVMLVTSEPARISEYAVRSRGDRVARFRADAVVVATPTGSHGYARAAEGPIVAPGTEVGPVVPIAPFATDEDQWVLPLDDIELSVERDETPVELLADDRVVGPVKPGEPIELSIADRLSVAVVDESQRFYDVEG